MERKRKQKIDRLIYRDAYKKGKHKEDVFSLRGVEEGPGVIRPSDDHHVEIARPFSLATCVMRVVSLGEGVCSFGLCSLDLFVGLGLIELHELGQIELRLLEHLDLLDEHVLEREDLGALLSDLLGNGIGEAAMNQILIINLNIERENDGNLQILEEISEG